MPTKSKPKIIGSDAVAGVNERDAINRINATKKNKSGNNSFNSDGVVPAEQLPPLSNVTGSDSVTEPAPSSPAPAPQSSTVTAPTQAAMTFNEDGTMTLTESQFRMLVDSGVRQETQQTLAQLQQAADQIAQLKQQQDAAEEKARKDREELEKQVENERKQRDTLARVFGQFGYAHPETAGADRAPLPSQAFISPLANRGGISAKDAVREFERRCNDAATTEARLITTSTGSYVQRNSRYTDQFFVENRKVLREGIDAIARQHGLLQGRNQVWGGKDAPTTFANFPIALREYLSQVVRIEHSARFVLWQFCNKAIHTGIPINQTVLVPRVRHLNVGVTSSDWRLTPGIPIVPTRQNLNGNGVSVPILEWGMGKDAVVEPLGIHELVNAVTIIDIERLVQERIGYNYGMWEDLLLFEILLSSTVVSYNNNGTVVNTAAGVPAGGGGQLTMNFFGSLRARMVNDKVPPLDDGCFIFVGTPDHFASLENDMAEKSQYADNSQVEGLTNMLQLKTRQQYMGKVNGYKGRVRGFHCFESTNISSGLPGSPGVQTETLGGNPVTTRSGFALGADALGMAESMPMEIRESDDTDFGRMRSLIWKTHANATGLDVDPNRTLLPNEVARAVGGEEQLRVYEVRSSTTKV
ncbi:hypothetical protein [Microcoleus sp. B3-D7]|uniref:hypothetical protein n=1 Tax=Microcoleus sp. B3-D7 TaxID=2818659 RepID=UPI002FD1DB43